jgi:polysaccharide biosynthesis transport protein
MTRAVISNQLIPAGPTGQRLMLDGEAVPLRALGVIPRLTSRGLLGRALGRGNARATTKDVIEALKVDGRAEDAGFRQGVQRVTSRLRNLSRNEVPQIVMLVSSGRDAGTSFSALAIAYAQALNGERTLLIDGASATPSLSTEFAGEIDQDHPCVLDSKEHLAEITSYDSGSGLTFLPIALADLRSLTMSQRARLANGINKLAMDYDLVVVDGGSIAEDESIAALADIASQVVVVARAGTYQEAHAQELVATLGVDPDRLAGVLITMGDTKGGE